MEGIGVSDRPLKISRLVDIEGQAAAVYGDPPQIDGDRHNQEGCQSDGLPRGTMCPHFRNATKRPVREALASSVLGGLVTLIESEASFVDRPGGSPLQLDFREKLAAGPRRNEQFYRRRGVSGDYRNGQPDGMKGPSPICALDVGLECGTFAGNGIRGDLGRVADDPLTVVLAS